MKRLAVLISNKGTGTNLQAIIDGIEKRKINAKIVAVISDTILAPGLERARKHKLPIKIVPQKEELLTVLQELNLDYICLAGWKQIILDEVIKAFPNRILNTHPGLIPDDMDGVVKNPDGTNALWNKGKMVNKAMQNFLDHHATYAGCTNHFLSLEFDFGPVLGRCFEKIRSKDTVKTLYTRLKVKENKLYADVLEKLSLQKTILIVDGGGRGAVLVDKYGQSELVGKILVVPGNDLMQINTKKPVMTYQNLKTTSTQEILEICQKEKVDLIDVAQDNAVEVGLVDLLTKKGFQVAGPTRKAGQIEWDKAWARKFMEKYQIPTPKFYSFNSEKDGIEFAKKNPNCKWFIKAAGLAEGKGAIPASSVNEAISAIKQMPRFGKAGEIYLLEEWLIGEELSAFALCDGKDFRIVGFAQDHKRVNDGDLGENTGGMGCVSNPLVVSSKIKKQVEEIFERTINGLEKEKRPYKGVLYLGGMVVDGESLSVRPADGPTNREVYVIEFNARWGDPEAEVIIPAIENDFVDLAQAIITGRLNKTKIKTDKKVRVVIAATSKGYPVNYSLVKGKKVTGIEQVIKKGAKVYGAGIKKSNDGYVVSGGRVLFIVGEGQNVIQARNQAYQYISEINIEGDNLHYRKDIGWRDLERLKK